MLGLNYLQCNLVMSVFTKKSQSLDIKNTEKLHHVTKIKGFQLGSGNAWVNNVYEWN